MPPKTSNIPLPLPGGLLARLGMARPLLLFLDYDGTLAEITPRANAAYPLAGAREVLAALAAQEQQCLVVIASGREIDQVTPLLGLTRGLMFIGSHGLEVMEQDGRRWMVSDARRYLAPLRRVRAWLDQEIPPNCGFVIEDKHLTVALHYRCAPTEIARGLCQRLQTLVEAETPALKTCAGKMVLEVMPRPAGKGYAVRFVVENIERDCLPVYFGDDTTDEDAFYALRDEGLTIKVGPPNEPSWARYRVPGPRAVVNTLSELAASLGGAELEAGGKGQ